MGILKGVKMASRRVAATSVNWAEFSKKVPASQKPSFQELKQKVDTFQRAVTALPEKAPAIDFNAYKSKIAVAGMVDAFQKKQEYQKFVAASKDKIAGINVEMAKWEAMIPIEDMTIEEFVVMVQRPSSDVYMFHDGENPRFWPHDVDYYEWHA